MPEPQDRAEPIRPNTLRDQAAPNALRSVSGISGRAGALDQDDAARLYPIDDPAAPPADGSSTAAGTAGALADLARHFEAQSLLTEARIVGTFQREAAKLAGQAGRLALTETGDERLVVEDDGRITADVIPEGSGGAWRHLATPDELVEFYDPTDLFDDLADALGRASAIDDPETPDEAAAQLEGLAAQFRGRGGHGPGRGPLEESQLLEAFGEAAEPLARHLGEVLLVDAPDERITLEADGRFRAAVVPDDDEGSWNTLRTAEELVEYYTPAELFDHLTARLRAAFPNTPDEAATSAVRLLADLARDFADRSRDRERKLIEQFELRAASLVGVLGEITVVDDQDERLTFGADGHFSASVVPKDQPGVWRSLDWPDELVEFYDPVDLFADLADALAEAYPSATGPDADSAGGSPSRP